MQCKGTNQADVFKAYIMESVYFLQLLFLINLKALIALQSFQKEDEAILSCVYTLQQATQLLKHTPEVCVCVCLDEKTFTRKSFPPLGFMQT